MKMTHAIVTGKNTPQAIEACGGNPEEDVYTFETVDENGSRLERFYVLDDGYQTTFDDGEFFHPADPDQLQALIERYKQTTYTVVSEYWSEYPEGGVTLSDLQQLARQFERDQNDETEIVIEEGLYVSAKLGSVNVVWERRSTGDVVIAVDDDSYEQWVDR
jgi:hypothetical protein